MTLAGNLAFLGAALKGERLPAIDREELARFARVHVAAEILDLPDARRVQAERSARLLAELHRVTSALRERGVGCIVLKGLGLAARFYGGLDRRATRDLDVLVAEEDLPAAERALAELGYRRGSIVPSRRLALRFTHAFDYERDRMTVDLHWTLARHPSYEFDLRGLRGRRVSRAIGGITVDVPCDEDALAIAILSVFRDLQRGGLRARAFVDVFQIVAACPELDWGAFLARRRAEGTGRIAVNILALMLRAFDARARFPALAAAVDAADVRLDAAAHLRALTRSRWALRNRLLALRLYRCSPARSILWWLVSMPVRVLVYRSWRVPRRRR